MALSRGERSKQAYTLVDLSELEEDIRKEIIDDAVQGGGGYGVRVVEIAINGPIQLPIFGVYKDVKDSSGNFYKQKRDDGVEVEVGNDETKWNAAKIELGITGTEVDDATVAPVDLEDPREMGQLREKVQEQANAEADKVRQMEDDEIREITKEDPAEERETSTTTKKNKLK